MAERTQSEPHFKDLMLRWEPKEKGEMAQAWAVKGEANWMYWANWNCVDGSGVVKEG